MSGMFGFEAQTLQIFRFLLLSSVFFFYGSQRLLKDKGLLWRASGDTTKCTVRLLLISLGHLRHAASDETPGEVSQQLQEGNSFFNSSLKTSKSAFQHRCVFT